MKGTKRKVVFPKHHFLDARTKSPTPKPTVSSSAHADMDNNYVLPIDSFLTLPPLLKDVLKTSSSDVQDATLAECLPLLTGINDPRQNPFDYDERGLKQLDRESHIAFAEDALGEFPAPFVSIDASRPWMIYWALTALHFLGEDPGSYRERAVKTFFPAQNAAGGFGGGQGHISHLAGTYATMLSLALVGGPDAYKLSDRQAMWEWLGRLKQADGGFQICEGGEEDTRAAYCALLVISLLDLPWTLPSTSPARASGLDTFGDGLGEYISRCQTYEGGISSEPGTEAHGAYTFCALAALCLLDAPHKSIPRYLDVDHLIMWLSSRQYAPEGGFAGRTNKVVDGCYSHWLGDCFPLVQAALTGPVTSFADHDVGDLYDQEGLSRYILNCCQSPNGGLRDKPSKGPDSYHTCYTLAGLSTTEHYHCYTQAEKSEGGSGLFESAFAWRTVTHQDRERQLNQSPGTELRGFGTDFRATRTKSRFHIGCDLNAVHPIFVVPHDAILRMREWAIQQPQCE